MQNYELAVLIDGEITPAKKKTITEFVSKVVKSVNGEEGKVEELGKRDLAYRLGKSTTGIYLFFPLKLDTSKVNSLLVRLNSEDKILRYLLVRKD